MTELAVVAPRRAVGRGGGDVTGKNVSPNRNRGLAAGGGGDVQLVKFDSGVGTGFRLPKMLGPPTRAPSVGCGRSVGSPNSARTSRSGSLLFFI